MANKNNFLKFDDEGFGLCRQCDNMIGRRDGRNFCAGYMHEKAGEKTFLTVLLLTEETRFRCPFCFTSHDFFPFRTTARAQS